MIAREAKRAKMVARYAEKRRKLREVIKSAQASMEEKEAASVKLQKLPKDSNPTRLRNRCHLTGRPHGYYRKFGLSRNKLREATMRGDVPGLVKASW